MQGGINAYVCVFWGDSREREGGKVVAVRRGTEPNLEKTVLKLRVHTPSVAAL